MAKTYEPEELGGVNIIATGTNVTGDIVSTGDCRIDGAIKGNIKSKSKVIIGQHGSVEGDIICQSIEIEGNVRANINVSELLSLKSTAHLIGNITVGKVSIEPGANFAGNCTMHNSKNILPNSNDESLNPL
ncbi:MAG: polymer-forming cytoskeletal protein [Bacteroidales bacterium]